MIFTKKFSYFNELIIFISGCAMPLAFAPFSLFPMAILSLAVLIFFWRNASPKRAFWQGVLFGIGIFGIGVSWVSVSFYRFGDVPFSVSAILTLGFVFILSSYIGLLGGLLARFAPKDNLLKYSLIIPSAWTIIEWIRGWFLTGFPWLSVGYSQIDSPLSGFAPLFGVYGISWIVVFSASLFVFAGLNKQKFAIIVVFILWGLGALLQNSTWNQAVDKPLDVVLLQANIPQEMKWLPEQRVPTMENYLKLSLDHGDADIIIWPETAIPMFFHQLMYYSSHFWETLLNEQKKGVDFLIGVPILNIETEQYFNSVMSLSDKSSVYYKRHLVPFGEYVPFQSTLGALLQFLNVPMSDFSAGKDQQANLQAAGQSIGVSICYEDTFGKYVRTSLPSASLLVNVSNDAWFGDSIAPHQHLEIARMRALESGRFLMRATNTGISAVINAKGKIVAQSPQFKTHALKASVQPYQGRTPYVYFGDNLVIILLILFIILGSFAQRRSD